MTHPRLNAGLIPEDKQIIRRKVHIYPRPHAIPRGNQPTTLKQTEDSDVIARQADDPARKRSPLPLRTTQAVDQKSSVYTWVDIRPPLKIAPAADGKRMQTSIAAVQPTPTRLPPSACSTPKRHIVAPKWVLFGAPSILVVLLMLSFFVFGTRNGHAKQAPPIKQAAHLPKSGVMHTQNLVSTIPNHGLPNLLEIPKIKVNAPIIYLGLGADGNMAAPSDVKHAGWYKYGPLPGNKGSAIIVGHLNGPKGQVGIFSSLSKLLPGDTISVVDDKHQAISFVVRSVKTYNQNDRPKDLFSSDGYHLNLVTCTGRWDPVHHTYSQRLVVLTDKV